MNKLPLILAALLNPVAAFATGYADLGEIDRAVASFSGAPQGQPGGAVLPVDRRLRLAQCSAPLALNWYNSRRESIVVRCPDANGWRLFVPVMASPMAAASEIVIARGEAVTIAVSGDGFTVSQPGESVDAGAEGAWIRVRAMRAGTAKGEPFRARVVRPGLVEVPSP